MNKINRKGNGFRKGSIAVVGGGKIGELIVALLSQHYSVSVYDVNLKRAKECANGHAKAIKLDAKNSSALERALKDKTLVINSCPYFMNKYIARAAAKAGTSYLDLSEDVESGIEIEKLAQKTDAYFVPRCGIAPGFIQIIAGHLIKLYETVDRISLRVGALPVNPTNSLKYNLTWSTDGLINEYGNPCEALQNGELKMLEPLEGYERLILDGVEYEAFNTSGGLGTLARTMKGKVKNLTYKTMRYLGHRDFMKFLLFDLKLNEYRKILKQVLESAVPTTNQDQVVVLCYVEGKKNGLLTQQTYAKTVRHGDLMGRHWSAIQMITASSAACVADLVMKGKLPHKGFVCQEEIDFKNFCSTSYGKMFSK
jgi:saccharopine dehydrogenase-like NADP-dependent oxidoreductase